MYFCQYSPPGITKLNLRSGNYETSFFAAIPLIPTYICSDGGGNFFVTSYNNGGVYKVTINGIVTHISAAAGSCNGIAIAAGGKLWVSRGQDQTNDIILMDQNTGAFNTVQTGFHFPSGINVSLDGLKLYIADTNNNTLKVMNTSNYAITSFGTFNNPYDLAIYPDGTKLFMLNGNNTTVSIISL